ncbi:hypothetical protein IGB42_00048 [Andreprevotia sp. IGB-42]|nr:hypothetical protein IGB42_00048 [Andreprevotia sp. IGB-42]
MSLHDLARSGHTGIYHLEVLGLRRGDPAWKVRHLVDHMAITEEALLRSIIKPLKRGGVYPESFHWAYQAWQALNHGAGGDICQSNVLQCMRDNHP